MVRSLQFQLLALYLLFAIPVTTAGVVFDHVGADRLKEQVTRADATLTNALASEVETSLQGALEAVNRFAHLPYVQILDHDKLGQTFRAAVSPQENRTLFFLWWEGGRFSYYTLTPYRAVLDDPSFTQLPFLQTALNTERTVVSNGWRMRGESGATAIIFQRWHTMEDGGHTGIVGMVLTLGELSTKLTLIQQQQKGDLAAVVLDNSGQVIASSEVTGANLLQTSLSGWFQSPAFPAGSDERGYWIEKDSNDNPAFLYSFASVPNTDWRIVLRHTAKTAFALSGDFHNGLLMAIVFYLICSIVFWWVVYRRVVTPLQHLKIFSDGLMARQTDSKFDEVPQPILEKLSNRADEIGNLTLALRRMERDLRMRLRELALLFEAGRRLASSLKPDEVVGIILEEVGSLLDFAGCAIVEIPATPGKLPQVQIKQERWSEQPLDWTWLTNNARLLGEFSEGHFIEAEIDKHGQMSTVDELMNPKSGSHHILILPLAVIQENIIVLITIARAQKVFPSQEISLLRSFSNQATLAIKNAGLYNQSDERLKQKISDLTALHEITLAINSSLELERVLDQIAQRATELTNTDWCTIRLADGNNENVYLAAHGEMLTSTHSHGYGVLPSVFALKDSITFFFRNNPEHSNVVICGGIDAYKATLFPSITQVMKETGADSYLGVPLRWQSETIGALNVYSLSQQQFSEGTVQLLTILANQAAAAIVNARLYQEVVGEKSRLEAITQSMEEGLLLENNDEQVVYANKVWCAALEQTSDSLVGWRSQHILQLLANLSDRPDFLINWEKQIKSEPQAMLKPSTVEFHLGRSEMRMKLFKVLNPVGESIGWGRLLQDITREKELDQVKSQLISTVSHELRTPLTIIKGNASTLLQTDIVWDAASQREFLEDILSESERLSRLVSDLLDLSRLELGKSILHKEGCRLDELVQEVIQAEQRRTGRTVHFSLLCNAPTVAVDLRRIQIVVRNLLENTFKYATDNTPVEVRLGPYLPDSDDNIVAKSSRFSFLLIEVEDKGPGILPKDKERIFERFHRLDNGYTRTVGGVGLGLAICRAFIEAHGGRIWVEDSSHGSGSIFKFTLPLDSVSESAHTNNKDNNRDWNLG